MNIEQFAKKYLKLELTPYQLAYLKEVHKDKHIVIAPRTKKSTKRTGKHYDLIVVNDISEIKQ